MFRCVKIKLSNFAKILQNKRNIMCVQSDIDINRPRSVLSWVCCLQVFNLLQIAPQPGGSVGNQFLIGGRE